MDISLREAILLEVAHSATSDQEKKQASNYLQVNFKRISQAQ